MPSRPRTPPPSSPASMSLPHHRYHPHRPSSLIIPIAAGSAALLVAALLVLLCRRLSRNRTVPAELTKAAASRFPYSQLRLATERFAPANKLGQGGRGSVYRGQLPGSGQLVAVKLMDSGSLQGEREFQNELALAALTAPCDRVVSLLGFSSNRRRHRRLLLVYELMPNRSLQDALLDRRSPELMPWSRRFSVALDVARGLLFLHCDCDPPIIHGDIKPSNILLDQCFSAKIADFGLSRMKVGAAVVDVAAASEVEVASGEDDNGSIMEETESLTPTAAAAENHSPERFVPTEASPQTVPLEASLSEILDRASASEGGFDKMSVESSKDAVEKRAGQKKWRRRGTVGGGVVESGGIRVKEYVMEWIGSEVKRERPKSGVWMAEAEEAAAAAEKMTRSQRKRHLKRLEWWTALDDDRVRRKKDKPRPRQAREWWREEFCEELCRKSRKKNKAAASENSDDQWWQRDDEEKKKKKRRSGSHSSMDWWMDGLSGKLRWGRRSSLDWVSGDISRSGCVSSTPSMRGTVCYIAPEYGGGGQLSEKCDVYSFGVLLLVVVSGRRPLQMTASPISEFERANLISWARSLSRCGKLLDLVDSAIQGVDKDQALLCITVALLCLQRSPAQRPAIKEVVAMLSGEAEPPHLPVEFSPSPPSGFPFKSGRKAR